MLKQNYPAAITHISTPAVAENSTSKGISLPAVSPLQKMDAAMEEPLGEPALIQMKAHLPPKFILQKTTPVENNVLQPFQLRAGAPVVQRTINILPGPHLQRAETAQRWNAQQAYARLQADDRANGLDQQLLLNVLTAMDTQNWFGASYQGFCQEVVYRCNAAAQQQQQQVPQDNNPVAANNAMEDLEDDEEEEEQEEKESDQEGHDFYDEDEMIDDDEKEGEKEEIEEGEEEIEEEEGGEPAYPTGIERSEIVMAFDEESGIYGAEFSSGFISSSGDTEDLVGIQIREVVQIGRNDLQAPPAIDTQETVIDEEGGLNDKIATNAARIHRSVPGITNFPAVYETPQKLYWKYAEENDTEWKFLVNVPITVTVVDKSKEGDEERDLRVITTYNGKSVKQPYRGDPVPRP
ncbi:hypothetical protein SAMN04488505_105308 [Chitinophaga rupis]|uniref:Uncharacterized protein n=1 Tax=Chitinophaga rupis TaxID=573321 RepID=A0A1H8A745_9BACT|nr:hypothetical protein [Chitinophaga rupis]SEM65367.1 hypothetical protein SAMN04488505_105308 [Chitinophaga rupis]